jgi:hypothetical protein
MSTWTWFRFYNKLSMSMSIWFSFEIGFENLSTYDRTFQIDFDYSSFVASFYYSFIVAIEDFLLLTRIYSIRAIDFNRDSNIEARAPIVPNRRDIIADSVFDYEQKLVYFYSQTSQMLFKSNMDGECIRLVQLDMIVFTWID